MSARAGATSGQRGLPPRAARGKQLYIGGPMTLHVHHWPTPNGEKVTTFLEQAEPPYRIIPCNIGRGDQFEANFLKLG
jgi:hypothetical protein